MKKLFTFILGMGAMLCANAQAPYAYDLSYDAANYNVQFKSTGDAPSANLILTKVSDGTKTTLSLGSITKGENSFYLGALEIGELEKTAYNWAVQVNGNAIAEAKRVYLSEISTKGTTARPTAGGVAFVRETESDAFGKIVVSVGFSQGIWIYSPTLEKEGTYHTSKFNSSNRSSSFRICENEGIIYVQDWSDAYSGIWTFDPISKSLGNFFEGTRGDGGAFTNSNGEIIGGGGTSVDIVGEGENRCMYSFQEDYPSGNAGNVLVRYDIGTAKTWGKVPDKNYGLQNMDNTNVEVLATENGVFISQIRTVGETANTKGCPAFKYLSKDGTTLFNSGSDMTDLKGAGTGMAINEDGTLFAFSEGTNGINIYSLSWNNNVPAFEKLYNIPNSAAAQVHQLDFDIAGNLHAFIGGLGYAVFELPQDAPTATTPAKKASMITIDSTVSVKGINVDADAPVEYYNLQGVKVENPEKGIFIKRQGSKTTKVVL
ncbi:MAG: hypothetical protein IJ328_04250 [Muribaculaceae bacterium]|nr:hypothetical protein [Muribaculaceae bacterium]